MCLSCYNLANINKKRKLQINIKKQLVITSILNKFKIQLMGHVFAVAKHKASDSLIQLQYNSFCFVCFVSKDGLISVLV